jgi:molybdopterin-guanine dinucleotide biosynthesis protein
MPMQDWPCSIEWAIDPRPRWRARRFKGIAEPSPQFKFKMIFWSQMNFIKVAIAGVSSEVGKTTLLCELLRVLPGWEAIKMTRGHYRSCGKDPHACCVSHLLGDAPLVRSGFRQTYASDKDTGRYWDAGAANVHWVIVTEDQVERGIELALERVKAPGVLIEGNSFLRFVAVDFTVLVTGGSGTKIKSSARWAFQKASAVYLFDQTSNETEAISPTQSLELLNKKFGPVSLKRSVLAYTSGDFPRFVKRIKQVHSSIPRMAHVPLRLEVPIVRGLQGKQS